MDDEEEDEEDEEEDSDEDGLEEDQTDQSEDKEGEAQVRPTSELLSLARCSLWRFDVKNSQASLFVIPPTTVCRDCQSICTM